MVQHIGIALNHFYENSDLVLVEDPNDLKVANKINTRRFKCVETEPGHVTLKDATEEG